MRHDDKTILMDAVQAMRAAEPGDGEVNASAKRVAERLGIEGTEMMAVEAIASCHDVRQLLPTYRAGTLPEGRGLLIRAHLRDCGGCSRAYNSTSAIDWSVPKQDRGLRWSSRGFAWTLAPGFALLMILFFVYRAFWQVPPGVRAEVMSVDGAAYRVSDTGNRPLVRGDDLNEGDQLRLGGGSHAVLRLADGSTVEVNERSVLGVGERGRNTTIALDDGAVIVQAAKRTSGHLFVNTSDCRVAVTGTVFSVNAGIKGSRVAVLEGSLHVAHGGMDSVVSAGDQLSTNANLSPEPVAQQVAWSQNRASYMLLLTQLDALQHRIEALPSPQLRYTSDLLQRVPADTMLYVSIPNLGDFLAQAKDIFNDQLKQSPALQQWWNEGDSGKTEAMEKLVDTLHQMSQYLGDEVVIVGMKDSDRPGFAIVADVEKSGLADFLKSEVASVDTRPALTVLGETSLAATPASEKEDAGGYALVRQHEVVFSNSIAMLKRMNAQLNAGASGFATGAFGQQIWSAYQRGAGMILAADVQQMLFSNPDRKNDNREKALQASGLNGVQYLIAEHRELNGLPDNHLNLQFSGTRERVASWLAAPAPMGALNFISPNASLAAAVLSKNPTAIADDLMSMAEENGEDADKKLNEAEDKMQINLRDDLAANLGGEFLVALDGPVLPTPSWKAVIEVRNGDALEKTLERLASTLRTQPKQNQNHQVGIDSSEVGGRRFYSLRDVQSGAIFAQYTFADGYMVLAPDRALVMEALHAYESGDSLGKSTAFKGLLPTDENANYSAIFYQNVGPVLTPLLSHLNGQLAEAVQKMAVDARPSAICAWGKDTRIEAASNSQLFGFDFLTLGAMLEPGNKQANVNVRD